MGRWKSGLFSCCDDLYVCCCTIFLPCYVAGKIADKVDKSCLICCVCHLCEPLNIIASTILREKVRDQEDIGGSIITDCLASAFCPCCVLAQAAKRAGPKVESDVPKFHENVFT
ncbi:hypothetical protein HELRODRAFT_159436 [Helobdella robusta]|uniref:Uncharacterized protein n=1 Tax=Helobdella robusta TaxID=6412 RepID=T1EP12_HELRO|nr:hypothetical protein HELRODRAFT_159436 [Helobdella robusta]ESO12848.1 hypothetical protein HELRODRAFT_159436 [Helobdella robusta]